MRVIAGTARGVPIGAPKRGTRPTSDLVKGALFSMIENLPGASWGRVLDLYAGSGALGIEALSRGAEWVDYVESNRAAARVIGQNLTRTGFSARARVHVLPVLRALQVLDQPYDIIFADPPYEDPGITKLVGSIAQSPVFGQQTILALEHSNHVALGGLPGVIELAKSRRHGDTCISIFRSIQAGPVS